MAATGDELLRLLAGEYNNNEQVWQADLDGARAIERRAWRFELAGEARLDLAMQPGQTAGMPAWAFELQSGSLVTTVNVAGTADDAGDIGDAGTTGDDNSACIYKWHVVAGGFRGQAAPAGGCPPPLPDYWRVTATHLHSGDEAASEPSEFAARRVHYYRGWVSLRRRHIDPNAADDDYLLIRDLRLHNEGTIFPITDAGQPTGYALEVARLTYQNTNTAILKLGIIEQSTGKTISYAWSAPLAERIGINLRWVQAGFTREQGARR